VKIGTGIPWTRLIPDNLGGDVRQWSAGFRWFINHLFIHFYHKIPGCSIEMWLDHIDDFKQAILDHLAQPAHPIEREYFDDIGHPERDQFVAHCPAEFCRVFGLLDNTNVRTCRPGSGPVGPGDGTGRPRQNNAYEILRAFYRSGYFKGHGLKYQTTLFPNGMVARVFSTLGSHNDVGVLNLSRLTEYLEQILFPEFVLPGGLLPALYGDAIFQNVNHMTIIACYNLVGTIEEIEFLCRLNYRMSGVWQSIEHMYGSLFNLFWLLKTP
jgi:hypothetical protein